MTMSLQSPRDYPASQIYLGLQDLGGCLLSARDAFCNSPGSHLVSLSQAIFWDSIWFSDGLSPQSILCNAVVVVPSLNLSWALSSTGKSCEAVLGPSCSIFLLCGWHLQKTLCVVFRKPFLSGKPWKERGAPPAWGSCGSLAQCNGMDFLRISLFMVQLRLSVQTGFRWCLLKAVVFLGLGQRGNKNDLTI